MDLERNIYEGWRPIDFINELEPSFIAIMSGQSWHKPFKTSNELKKWCDAKVNSIDKLKGIPVEVTFEDNMLKEWRILTEVL